jgi:hypothetical protein
MSDNDHWSFKASLIATGNDASADWLNNNKQNGQIRWSLGGLYSG